MVQRTIEFNDLRKLVLERWELDINGPSQLYYKDDEGDRIKIDSSEFKRLLQRHFATSDIVRIHIDSGKTNKGSTRPRVQSGTSEESDQVNMGSPSNNSKLISVPVVGRRGSVEDERVDPNTTAELFSRGREEPTSKNRLPSRTANRTGTTTAPAVDPWQVTLEAMEKDKMPWRKLGAIGKGAYGTVYEGVLENGRHVAVKVLDVPRQVQSTIEESAVSGPGQSVRKLIREINLMRRLEHKNIVAYIHCHITKLEDDNVRHRGGRSSLMTTPRNVNQPLQIEIIMELCSRGPLSQIVKQSPGGRLSVVEARKYIKQILQGLMYLHSRGVIHRDIKADKSSSVTMGWLSSPTLAAPVVSPTPRRPWTPP
ncbi:hypothetical protein AGDE_15008 [Angomonas deanei]|nr:hypothetical protein AGDE_15008 [Angomonas deanei]|eukprot:EPY19840.1 hypothetical protein AGDE_15008 [Angomonas deanei]